MPPIERAAMLPPPMRGAPRERIPDPPMCGALKERPADPPPPLAALIPPAPGRAPASVTSNGIASRKAAARLMPADQKMLWLLIVPPPANSPFHNLRSLRHFYERDAGEVRYPLRVPDWFVGPPNEPFACLYSA